MQPITATPFPGVVQARHGIARSHNRHRGFTGVLHPLGLLYSIEANRQTKGYTMIRTAFKCATVITGFVLAGSSVLNADSFGPSSDRKHALSRPSVTTHATGLTNPRGLAFGPDRNLYVAEAGIGGSLTPTGGPGCPVNVNVFSPYTAGYSGRVTRVLRDGTKETVAHNLPSMTDNSGVSYGVVGHAGQVVGDCLLRAIAQHAGHAAAVAGSVGAEYVDVDRATGATRRCQRAANARLRHVKLSVRTEGQAPWVGQARGVRRHGWPGERVFPVARRPEGIRVEHAGAREHESGDHGCTLERGADHGVPLGLSVGFDGI